MSKVLEPKNAANGQENAVPTRTPGYWSRAEDDGYIVGIELPGVSKEDIELRVEEGTLSVYAGYSARAPEGWNAHYREVLERDYRLNLKLGKSVDTEKISAKLENGVLRISLPKAEALKPKQICVV